LVDHARRRTQTGRRRSIQTIISTAVARNSMLGTAAAAALSPDGDIHASARYRKTVAATLAG
jgi:hypothetical protein